MDLTNKTFYDLTVIDKVEHHANNGNTYVRWKCKCICGNEVILTKSQLISGHVKSCGCRCNRCEDITNKKYNKLTALYIDKNNKKTGILNVNVEL